MQALEKLFLKIIDILEKLHIPYMLVGGLAANFYGMPRATFDIDIQISLSKTKLEDFVKELKCLGFNLYLEDIIQMLKVSNRIMLGAKRVPYRIDFWFFRTKYEKMAFERRRRVRVYQRKIWIVSPEDLIIHKLLSSRAKDIEDISSVFKVTEKQLDIKYINHWVKVLDRQTEWEKLLKQGSLSF